MAGRSVFTITGGVGFLRELARGILDRYGSDPGTLAGIRILVPNRRACASLAEAFLQERDGKPTLLPEISPIGDVDDSDVPGEDGLPGPFDLPPAISPLRRRLVLSQLVLKRDPALRPAHAVRLADGLARLLDEVQTARLDFAGLGDLVPEQLAEHWQKTLAFLEIVTAAWPDVVAEFGCMDPLERRNRLIEARIRSWQELPPDGPVIAAGSTGTVPATADLLVCVAAMEHGAVVLPGFDGTLEGEVGPTHPQYGMARLVRERFGLGEVPEWNPGEPRAAARVAVVNAALRPPAAVAEAPESVAGALAGVRRIECPGPQEEARVIAMLLREVLEVPERTAALVTPDRRLARRVAAELRRWRIEIDDSGGEALASTLPGTFLRLTAEAVASGAAPVPLLAALKHPLAAAGEKRGKFLGRVRHIERMVLRGPRPKPGFAGLRAAIEECEAIADPGRREDLAGFAGRLGDMAERFADLLARDKVEAREILEAHIGFAEALAAGADRPGARRLWAYHAGEQASLLIGDLHDACRDFPAIAGADWPALLDTVLARAVVRPPYGQHPRLSIRGLLEARLQHADLVVMGGLNEGTWPPDPATDPWMSRSMRADFGLEPPERHIGQTAHDFVQGFSASGVVLTRATRVDGSPTVPARWLTRLETLLSSTEEGRGVLASWQAEQEERLRWQADLDLRRPPDAQPAPARRPQPVPPVEARPARLSVTQIETLIRDPYAIYARHVLGLRALDPLDAAPGAADRGTVIHAAVERFFKAWPGGADDEALDLLVRFGDEAFAPFLDRPGVRAFWWPRFRRIAEWLVRQETERAHQVRRRHIEVSGEMTLPRRGEPFVLTGRADRIDALADGGYVVIDYKTGALPSKSDVDAGLAPQLPLEAAMVAAGAFDGVPPGPVTELSYWKLAGGNPAGDIRDAGGDAVTLAQEALEGLKRLLAAYEDPGFAYRVRPDPEIAPRYSDYAHLERLQEWTASGDPE